MSKGKRWQLQEAKNKLSQVAEEAVAYGPQVITKRGEDSVVVLSRAEYERLTRPSRSLVEFLAVSPLAGSGLEVDREPDPGRPVEGL
ncbi:MAG: type II toxin-antitoxin system Phd/YefM family antitoxin [Gemmatimonadota bacterium]